MSSTSVAGAASESATHLGDFDRASSSNAPSPTAASSDLTPAPEVATSQSAHEPQPTDASALTADQYIINGHDDVGSLSATYGTRSRKSGRARPNYADDKEIDAEIEAAGRYSKGSKKLNGASGPPPAQEVVPARNGFAVANGAAMALASSSTALANGTHTSVQPPVPTSKKRKQPGSNITVPAAQSTPPPVSTPKSFATHRPQFLETNVLSFSNSRARLNNRQQLVADDGTAIGVNDHMYFICEPPGDPYYLGRIMEFLHVDNTSNSPVEAVRVNWFYRPKDIQRRVQDTRVVFASMHSDTCPLSSMRGKCSIRHLADIPDLDDYRKQPNSFWFDKLYDRYMHRYYEVIPTSKVVNVPRRVKKVLDERWKFVLVEVGRGRDLTSASKVCKRCGDFAANHESVDCAVCKNTYHMSCVRPPLLKKPARGFAWACGPCSRAQELKMEARNTPISETELSRLAEAESFDEEEESQPPDLTTRENSVGPEEHSQPTAAQLAQANLWPWRYLGIHARPEDALDYDDRIYPRASSRLGPRHQANITVWHGRPIEYIKAAEGKKKYKPIGGTKKDSKAVTLSENDKREKRPKWVFDEPPGYVARGQDEPIELKGKKEYTAQLTFKMPDPSKFTERGLDSTERPDDYNEIVDAYLQRCDNEIAPKFNLKPGNVDIRTKGLEKLQENNYDVEKAMEAMRKVTARTDLKLPELTKDEIKRFEEGVSKFGSELHAVARHVSSTIKDSRIVRFYYMWKKTDRGKEIWGNFEGRKSKKDSKRVEKDASGARLLDDVADDGDDSAFDEEKAAKVRRGFKCKHCSSTSSRTWRRAPATAPGTLVPRDPSSKNTKDKSSWLIQALCGKCAYLWRRYAAQYESIEELGKKIVISGGRASKRKVDEETMRIVIEAQNFAGDLINKNTAQIAISSGIEVPVSMIESDEPANKKKRPEAVPVAPELVIEKKKVVPEKPAELEPLKPEMPRVKEHPCAVCHIMSHPEHKMLKCRDCRLHVHAPCYGVNAPVGSGPWYCDMCKNDHNTQVSTNYECVLCPVRRTPQELMEPPKISHKKKTDREREKERAEREMVNEAGRRWREDQLAAGRPVDPREPLKRTAWNNWIHVNCAVWCKEIRFGDAENLDAAEGIGFIPRERFETACKYCNEVGFPVVTCQFPACNNNFHIGCAHQKGLTFGFDISPVKMSRRDSVPVMKLDQEIGLAAPGIWCPHHAVPTIVHNMLEQTPSGLTALQEYVRTYKQVDNSVTGTVRRAAQFQSNLPTINVNNQISRRVSHINGHAHHHVQVDSITGRTVGSPSPASPQTNGEAHEQGPSVAKQDAVIKSEKRCCSCLTEFSPKWWKVDLSTLPAAGEREAIRERQRRSSEGSSVGGTNAARLSSPHQYQPAPSTTMPQHVNHQVKPEPMDVETMTVPEECLLQCHKCHVSKRTPPPSPSLLRRREAPPPPAANDLSTQPAIHPSQTLPHPIEKPPHSHPILHGPPHTFPAAGPWPNGTPRNGAPGPPSSAMYGHSLYNRSTDYGYPFPPPPLHYAGSVFPSRARSIGLPQHSPPPSGPYIHAHAGPPPTSLPPGQPVSPHLVPANGPTAYQTRPGDSPGVQYGGLRAYQQPPSSLQTTPRAPMTEQPRSDSKVVPGASGHRLSGGIVEPPRAAHQVREEPTRETEGQDGRATNAGPGASASPSLRNLLS